MRRHRSTIAALGLQSSGASGYGSGQRANGIYPYLAAPALTSDPTVILGCPPTGGPVDTDALVSALRTGGHVWPVSISGAITPERLVVDDGSDAARAALESSAAVFGAERTARLGETGSSAQQFAVSAGVPVVTRLAEVAPDHLASIWLPAPSCLNVWAHLLGIEVIGPAADWDASAPLAQARAVDPWRGREVPILQAVAILAELRRAAERNRDPIVGVGMTRWKRRCVSPFLHGPGGPPVFADTLEDARRVARPGTRFAMWGASVQPAHSDVTVLGIEDGFLRSVGLGVKHTPPASLSIDHGAPYFDARGPNAFDATVEAAEFPDTLVQRAREVRETIVAARLTKYNITGRSVLPDPKGQERVLVPGQVEGDMSIVHGARLFNTNAALIEAARTAFPDAFLVYKPHPDVLSGRRKGTLDTGSQALADHIETGADMPTCLDWADRVAVLTSLAGFEALLRDIPVTTFGRPFFAGWGLTDDRDPPPRARTLSRDALVAAALILYPSYIDPATQLPAPVERVIEALIDERNRAGTLASRLRTMWRTGFSWFTTKI